MCFSEDYGSSKRQVLLSLALAEQQHTEKLQQPMAELDQQQMIIAGTFSSRCSWAILTLQQYVLQYGPRQEASAAVLALAEQQHTERLQQVRAEIDHQQKVIAGTFSTQLLLR